MSSLDEKFVSRLKNILESLNIEYQEKHMFGGLAFMVRGHMMVGIMNTGEFMARVGKGKNDQALQLPGAKQMAFRKPMLGYITVSPVHLDDDTLRNWVSMCWEFNQTMESK